MNPTLKMKLLFGFTAMTCLGCVTGEDFDTTLHCRETTVQPLKVSEFRKTLDNGVRLIAEDTFLKLYVTSSDQEGNIYGAIYLQDDPEQPATGIELKTDLTDAYLLYPPGTEVILSVQGLYGRIVSGGIQLGSKLNSFGNLSIGRLPAVSTKKRLLSGCKSPVEIRAKILDLDSLGAKWQYIYVRFKDVQLAPDDLCKPFAEEHISSTRKLTGCKGAELELVNSGYSDFYDLGMPSGKGTTSGILKYRGSKPQLILNRAEDLEFTDARCEGVDYYCDGSGNSPVSTAYSIVISEIADPVNTSTEVNSRFIELYNSGEDYANLSGWEVRRYTNANEEYTESSVVILPPVLLPPGEAFVIAANTQGFEQVYGFYPDMAGGSSSAADSNGDDTMVLVDPEGEIRDIFGVIGEDGTETAHDFQDGRAVRVMGVMSGSSVFTSEEWLVYNGHGDHGTILGEQRAPDDFDPGIHNRE